MAGASYFSYIAIIVITCSVKKAACDCIWECAHNEYCDEIIELCQDCDVICSEVLIDKLQDCRVLCPNIFRTEKGLTTAPPFILTNTTAMNTTNTQQEPKPVELKQNLAKSIKEYLLETSIGKAIVISVSAATVIVASLALTLLILRRKQKTTKEYTPKDPVQCKYTELPDNNI